MAKPKKLGPGLRLSEDGRVEARVRVSMGHNKGLYVRRFIPNVPEKAKIARVWREQFKEQWDKKPVYLSAKSNGHWLVILPANKNYPLPYERDFGYDYESAVEWGKDSIRLRDKNEWLNPDEAAKAPITFDELWELWLEKGTVGLEFSTIHRYTQLWSKHLQPHWGSTQVVETRRFHIQDWITNCDKEGTSPATVEDAFAVLSVLLSFAVFREELDSNPAQKKFLKFRKHAPGKVSPISKSKVMKVFEHPERLSDQLALKVGYNALLRVGELLPLRVRDFDSETGLLTVGRIITRLPGGGTGIKSGHKTGAGAKTATLARGLADELQRYIDEMSLASNDLLFPSKKGELWDRDNFRNRIWYPALESAGVVRTPHMSGLHLLRRTGITHAKNSGASSIQVTAQTKHTDIGTLENSYFLQDESDSAYVAELLWEGLDSVA
jgi:integrase